MFLLSIKYNVSFYLNIIIFHSFGVDGMNEINTKELGIFEIFSIGWGLFRDNFIQFFKITVILGLPLSILLSFADNILLKIISNGDITSIITGSTQLIENLSTEQLLTVSALMIISMFIQALIYPLITIAVADAAGDSLSGRVVDARKSVLNALSKGTVVMASSVIYWVAIVIGLMFFIIPGIILLVLWYFYEYTIIFDDAGIINSFKMSMDLVKGKWFKTAGYILLISIVNGLITRTLTFFIGALQLFFIGDVLFMVILFFLYTFIISVITVFYLNRKALYIKDQNKNNMYF